MKKIIFGVLAIIVACAGVAFTSKYEKKSKASCSGSPSVYWFHVKTTVSKTSCTAVDVTTDLDQLPTADGATDTNPFDNMTAATSDPFGCSGLTNICAVAYLASTAQASDYEVINIGTQQNPDYRWRPKATTTITCCVKRN